MYTYIHIYMNIMNKMLSTEWTLFSLLVVFFNEFATVLMSIEAMSLHEVWIT